MTIEKKAKWIAGTLTGLLMLAMVSSVYLYNDGQGYKSDAERARLSQDSVLAVKQLLDKEIADMRIELADAKGKNAELDERLVQSETALTEKQTRIDKLLADNASVHSLRNQLKELKAERETMNLQIQNLLAENLSLQADNQSLRNSINLLEGEKLALQTKLNAANQSANRAGNFRVDMLRNNGKVTSKAKRTRDIRVSFDMPLNSANGTAGKTDTYLVIIDPQGKTVTDKKTKSVTLNNGTVISPLKTQSVDLSLSPQTVQMNVSLESKVKDNGIYKVQVYTLDGMIGSSQITMN
jgi:hypothetical protein